MRDPDLWFDVGAFAYAHRGLWDDKRPENSIAAFEAAAQAGVGCELDVRITADGRLVVFHDETLERMCGRPERVDALTFAEVHAARLPDGSQIPTLDEALEAMAGLPTLIEIKIDKPTRDAPPNREARERTRDILEWSSAPAGTMSFDEAIVWGAKARRIMGSAIARPVGQLIEPLAQIGVDAVLGKAARAVINEASYLAPHISCLEIVAQAHPRVPLVTWTIRSPEELETARRFGAAPIFEGFSPALAKPAGNPI